MDAYGTNKRNHPSEHAIAKQEYAHAHGIAGGGVIPFTPKYKTWVIRRVSELLGGEPVRNYTRVGDFASVGMMLAAPPAWVSAPVETAVE